MASIRSYVDGAGGSTGATLATAKPLLASGQIWYVNNSVTGASDANAGTERIKPLLTLQQAVTNAGVNDIIDVGAGHVETISTGVVISTAGIALIGEGSGSTVPMFTNGTASNIAISLNAAGITMDNFQFAPSTTTSGTDVQTGAAGIALNALTFNCGASDTGQAINLSTSTSQVSLTNIRFTSVGATPSVAIECPANMADVRMDNVIFDGGSFGWTTYAMRFDATITRIKATNIYLLHDSDVLWGTGCTGFINVVQATGGSQINWTP